MSSTPNCEKTSRGGADESNSGISTSAEKGRPEQASQPITLPEVRKQHGHQIEDRIFEQAIDDLNWLAVIEFIEEAIEVPDRRNDDVVELKTWIVKKLENISDADSDVLADYVLALTRVDTPEPDLHVTAVESLEDFLKDDTTAFVNDIFEAVHTRSYKAGYVAPGNLPTGIAPQIAPPGPAGAYGSLGAGRGTSGGFQESRKRSYNPAQENGGTGDSHYMRGDRQTKHIRRGGRGGRGEGLNNRGGRGAFPDSRNLFPHAGSPPLQPGFPSMPNIPLPRGLSFDPNDPMAAIMAMQAMRLPPLPGMPPPHYTGSPNGHQQVGKHASPISGLRRERCKDYDTQGYCARGDSCPYEHGTDRLIAPGQDEYDPRNSLLGAQPTSPITNGHNTPREQHRNGTTRGRGRGDRGGFPPRRQNNRAEFSQAGPNHDRSITTIVVERIPEEKFDEQSVRDFFSDFGNIVEVTMQPYKRLALVKYDDYNAALRAYDSPKVIFDNRFVKVYWYNPNTLPTPPLSAKPAANASASGTDDQIFDKEEFERNALAAQKKLEEKNAQMKEMNAKRQALEKQKEELALKQAEEKRKLLEKLAAKGVTSDNATMTAAPTNGTNGADDSKASAHTKALRAKVAELEAEAKSLGLDSALSDYTPRGRGRGRGRGSYRGWEGFATPSPRGRGGFRGRVASSGYNLDLRTKKVAVSGVDFDTGKDEGLRQYLLGVGEYQSIEPHPDHPETTQIITFKDRLTAETFMYGTKDIPNVGKLEFSWYNAPAVAAAPTAGAKPADGDVGMGGMGADGGEGKREVPMDDYDVVEDYDVADDIS